MELRNQAKRKLPMNSPLSHDPTFLGEVASVSGASVRVYLAQSIASGLSIIDGRAYRIGQVGSFVRIPQGYQDLFGIVTDIGVTAAPNIEVEPQFDLGRWMLVQLIGESIGNEFERGISQYPNVGDATHLVTEDSLARIYGTDGFGHVSVGTLSSAESIPAKIALDELVTRHSAIVGSTGAGKSTAVAGLLQAITGVGSREIEYPSARAVIIDIHGEYTSALSDVATIFSVDPEIGEEKLLVPFWALNASDLLSFLTGGVEGRQETAFTDKIRELKTESHQLKKFHGVQESSITVDTPIPFSLHKLWYDLIDFEITTFKGANRDIPALQVKGDPEKLIKPVYEPHGLGSSPPFINQNAIGIQRQLDTFRSYMLDRRYDFLLHPGDWEPKLSGETILDLDQLLLQWVGGNKSIVILDLSSVPSIVLERLVGSILKIIFDSLYWSRDKAEGGIERPLLIVMEEAHRYLTRDSDSLASEIVRQIAKEGRKYGVGAMVVSQRPSEVDDTVLSQCGTFFSLRLSNPLDRERVRGMLPDGLVPLLDALPILRTGEIIAMGEATKLPMRFRTTLPGEGRQPQSKDPNVSKNWSRSRKIDEMYAQVVASWRAQRSKAVVKEEQIQVESIVDTYKQD